MKTNDFRENKMHVVYFIILLHQIYEYSFFLCKKNNQYLPLPTYENYKECLLRVGGVYYSVIYCLFFFFQVGTYV